MDKTLASHRMATSSRNMPQMDADTLAALFAQMEGARTTESVEDGEPISKRAKIDEGNTFLKRVIGKCFCFFFVA